MNNLLYLALQSNNQLKHIKASLMSLNHISDKHYKVYIYTNLNISKEQFRQFKNIDIIIKKFTPITDNYIYKNKIKVLIEFIEEYNEKIIFIDNDTFFYVDPSALYKLIDEKTVVMNYKETTIKDYKLSKWRGRKKHPYLLSLYNEIKINDHKINNDTVLCNSGVIGIMPSHLNELKDAFKLCSYIQEKSNIKTSEQIALSIVFQNKYDIKYSDDVIFHYHFYKMTVLLLNHIFKIDEQQIEGWDKYFENKIMPFSLDEIVFDNLISIVVKLGKRLHKKGYQELFYYVSSDSVMYKLLDGKNYE